VSERLAQAAGPAVVVGLGSVDPALVTGPLRGRASFVASPRPEDLSAAAGAIVRADVVVDRALLGRMPSLRVLARTGVGVDLVDVDAATERGIAVVITPGSGTGAVAEGVIGMALHLAKRFGPLTSLVRTGGWAQRHQVAVGDLEGSTIGIIGYGRIGQRVGHLARAFGMRVLAYDPVAIPPDDVRCDDVRDIAACSDVITLHSPLTQATRHLVGRGFLSAVRPGALLINCGRGALIDPDAVLDALRAGQLSGVGLDVFEPEPPAHHPLFDHPDVVLTPHLMGLSRRATAATFADAARGVADVLAGQRPAALANPAWTPAPRPDDRPADREAR
jgi:D-3-phosphoglycerate dehydrogenase / 2-oxoglutarate reductase